MDLSRIGLGKQIAAAGALLLIISLFLPWYGADVAFEGVGSVSFNGWESTDFADILLFIAGAVTLGLVVGEATGKLPHTMRFPPLQIMQTVGGTAVILMIFRLVDTPDGLDREWGLFVAFIAAAAMTYGSYRAQSESGSYY